VRARAWLLLAEGAGVRGWADFERHLDAALAECEGDPGVTAYVLARKAGHAAGSAVARIREAEALALRAVSRTACGTGRGALRPHPARVGARDARTPGR